MESPATPFLSLAPVSPVPVAVDYVLLANDVPSDPSQVHTVET